MNHMNRRHAVCFGELMKQCNNSRRGFYDFLYENVTKDEATTLKFCLKNKLVRSGMSCRFCKIPMTEQKKTSTYKCPGSCKRTRSLRTGTVFQTCNLPLNTILKIIAYWCLDFSVGLTTKLSCVDEIYVRYWYGILLDVCAKKLQYYGVPCQDYSWKEVQVTWRHIFGTCVLEQQSQTYWVKIIAHLGDIRPPHSAV